MFVLLRAGLVYICLSVTSICLLLAFYWSIGFHFATKKEKHPNTESERSRQHITNNVYNYILFQSHVCGCEVWKWHTMSCLEFLVLYPSLFNVLRGHLVSTCLLFSFLNVHIHTFKLTFLYFTYTYLYFYIIIIL